MTAAGPPDEGVGFRPHPFVPSLVLTPERLRDVVSSVLAEEAFVVDVETTFDGPHANEILWVGLATYGQVHCIPINHPHGRVLFPGHNIDVVKPGSQRAWKNDPDRLTKGTMVKQWVPPVFGPAPTQLRADKVFEILRPLFFSDRIKIGHNLKFDLMSIAKYYGGVVPPGPYEDTIVLAHIANEDRMDFALKSLIPAWLLPLSRKREDIQKFYPNLGKAGVWEFGLEEVSGYLAKDVLYCWMYRNYLWQYLDREGLEPAVTLEMDTYPAIMEMEMRGVQIDQSVLDTIDAQLGKDIHDLEVDAWRISGEQYPLTQVNKKKHYLFASKADGGQGLKPIKFSRKTNEPSVDKETLDKYAESNQLANIYQQWSKKAKLKSAFVDTYKDPANLLHGRVHGSFHQHRTDTGRLSSSSPNLMQLPRPQKGLPPGSQMREAFVASPGYILVGADYDQVELRCIAHLSRDPEMIRLFVEGEDIHAAAAAAMLNIPEEEVTSEQRTTHGKLLNFGVGYGASALRISRGVGSTIDEAQTFINRYYERFSNLPKWKLSIVKEAVGNGDRSDPVRRPPYISIPPYDRRRRLPDLFSPVEYDRARAQRQAVNAVVQGFASYIMKVALIDLHNTFKDDDVHLLLTVHDEVIIEAPTPRAEEVRDTVTRVMSGVTFGNKPILGKVPLIVSANIGTSWLECK